MDTKIKNPMTGRWIKVGGVKYDELVKNGMINSNKNVPKKMAKKFTPPKNYSVPQTFANYPVDKSR